jgi:XTP/dITP diphosphohydrolase
VFDDVPTAQPALALAQKVIQRVGRAGLPADLIPEAITSVTVTADGDAENGLRTAVLEFMDSVRRTERAVAAGRRGQDNPDALDVAPLGAVTEEQWRAYWPQATDRSQAAAVEPFAASDESFDEPPAGVENVAGSQRPDVTAEASAGDKVAPAVGEGEIGSETSGW